MGFTERFSPSNLPGVTFLLKGFMAFGSAKVEHLQRAKDMVRFRHVCMASGTKRIWPRVPFSPLRRSWQSTFHALDRQDWSKNNTFQSSWQHRLSVIIPPFLAYIATDRLRRHSIEQTHIWNHPSQSYNSIRVGKTVYIRQTKEKVIRGRSQSHTTSTWAEALKT